MLRCRFLSLVFFGEDIDYVLCLFSSKMEERVKDLSTREIALREEATREVAC